jgi:hypothetical protein
MVSSESYSSCSVMCEAEPVIVIELTRLVSIMGEFFCCPHERRITIIGV